MIKNLLRTTLSFLSVIILNSCVSEYQLMKYGCHKEVFVIPPTSIFVHSITFEDDGKLNRKDQPISIYNLTTSSPVDSSNIKISRRYNQVTRELEEERETLLSFKGILEEGRFSFHSVWKYEHLYTDGNFHYKKFISVIDELRKKLSSLETSFIPNSTDFDSTEFISWQFITDEDRVSLKEGQSQIILNAIFENLPLPNSVTLYNYGYLSPLAVKESGRTQFSYYFDEGFTLNSVHNTIVADPASSGNKIFGLNFSTSFYIARINGKLRILNHQLSVNGLASDDEGAKIGTSPFDFNSFSGKYLFLYSGLSLNDKRNVHDITKTPRLDVALIAVDNLEEADKILDHENPIFLNIVKQLDLLGMRKKWFRIKSNIGIDFSDRVAFLPAFPIYFSGIYRNERYKSYATFGVSPKIFNTDEVYEIRRERTGEKRRALINRAILGVRAPESREIYNKVLLLPNDRVKLRGDLR